MNITDHHEYQRQLKRLRVICFTGAIFSLIVITVGAATRLTDAGLGCPDWPGCYGKIWIPDETHALSVAPAVPLEPFKAGMEMVHRYLATMLGIIVIYCFYLGIKIRKKDKPVFQLSAGLFLMVLLQGAFGAWTVTLKLLPIIVTAHLLGGLICFSLFLILGLRASGCISATPRFQYIPKFGCIALLFLAVQIFLGGWTSTNYAAVGCVGFPTCNGQMIPNIELNHIKEGFDVTAPVGPDYLYGKLPASARTAIHYTHRLGALILGLAILFYWYRSRLSPSLKEQRAVSTVLIIYALQVLIGISTVLFGIPLSLALIHTVGAALLLGSLLRALSLAQHRIDLAVRTRALIGPKRRIII